MPTAEASPRTPLRIPSWQPWTAVGLFALLLHFVWEMLQFPLFIGMSAAPHGEATRACLIATLGDAAIILIGYGCAAAVTRSRLWALRPGTAGIAVYLAVGLALALLAEYIAVRVLARWSYAPAMPTVLGIGLAPLLQWVVVPPLILWLVRTHVAGRTALSTKETL